MSELVAASLASGLSLSYAEWGDRMGPALVALPGPTDSWRSYEPVLDRMPPSIRAIAVSQRGHGDSDKPATGYGVEDFASDVPQLLDVLGIERAVLAGHSASCMFARRVAIDAPDRVAGLVLEGSPMTLWADERLRGFVESVVSNLQDPIDPEFARTFVVDTSGDSVDADTVELFVAELLKVPAYVWRVMFAALLTYDDTSELARVAAPTLLIWGDADALVRREAQDELLVGLPRSELLVYRGVGHTPRWEDPARFASDVASFVERIAV